mmetsp:Transcript_67201/g.186164  ORF Transcript_67201/g.186164 Transcript_67201/m.186164 type:complete len:478 (+) Transcript_67201:139-1572(+)
MPACLSLRPLHDQRLAALADGTCAELRAVGRGAAAICRHLRHSSPRTSLQIRVARGLEGAFAQGVAQQRALHLEGRTHLACDEDEVDGLGGALEPHAAAEELLKLDAAVVVRVEHLEEAPRLGDVDVYGLEEVHHLLGLQALIEVVEGDPPGLVHVEAPEEPHGLVHLLDLLHLGRALDCALHKQRRNNIHHREGGKEDVQEERHAAPGRDMLDEGRDQVVPVDAPREPLEQREEGAWQGAKPRCKLPLAHRVLEAVDKDGLRDVYAHNVNHDEQQCRRPDEGLHGVHDAAHHQPQLPREAGKVQRPDGPERPEHAGDAQEETRVPRGDFLRDCPIATDGQQDLLADLDDDEHGIERVPDPTVHPQEFAAEGKNSKGDLDREDDAEEDVQPAEGRGRDPDHVPCHDIRLHPDQHRARRDHGHDERLEARVPHDPLRHPLAVRKHRTFFEVNSLSRGKGHCLVGPVVAAPPQAGRSSS